MSVYRNAVVEWLADTRLARQVMEAVFHAHGRYHLARFGRQSPRRCQSRTLFGLLHQARATRFGREHDFDRIRTVEDFRRLVPVRTPAELWRNYWQQTGAAWPGPLPTLAAPRVPGEFPVALSPALQATHRAALRTALALVLQTRPHARLFAGSLLFLGDGTLLTPAANSPEAVAAERLPAAVRPYALAGVGWQCAECRTPEAAVRPLAEYGARIAVTCLAGDADHVLAFLERVKQITGRGIPDVWPGLAAVLYNRRPASPPPARLRAEVGGRAQVLETAFRPEGPVAVEDPAHGALRLLTNHGVYFEFVPAEQAGHPDARRHGVEEVEPGVPYELVLTSPAGWWACRTGRTVCFERRDPPLFRFVEPAPVVRPAVTLPAPHRQTGGTPAGLPGTLFHTPWSAPADRG